MGPSIQEGYPLADSFFLLPHYFPFLFAFLVIFVPRTEHGHCNMVPRKQFRDGDDDVYVSFVYESPTSAKRSASSFDSHRKRFKADAAGTVDEYNTAMWGPRGQPLSEAMINTLQQVLVRKYDLNSTPPSPLLQQMKEYHDSTGNSGLQLC